MSALSLLITVKFSFVFFLSFLVCFLYVTVLRFIITFFFCYIAQVFLIHSFFFYFKMKYCYSPSGCLKILMYIFMCYFSASINTNQTVFIRLSKSSLCHCLSLLADFTLRFNDVGFPTLIL